MRVAVGTTAMLLLASAQLVHGQQYAVVDVHVHAGAQPQALAAVHESLRVRFAVVSGLESDMGTWAAADTSRFTLV
jgi:hypothetical protein